MTDPLRLRLREMVVELKAAQATAPAVGSFRTMLLRWMETARDVETVLEALEAEVGQLQEHGRRSAKAYNELAEEHGAEAVVVSPDRIAAMKDVVDANIMGDGHRIEVSREDLYQLGEKILDGAGS